MTHDFWYYLYEVWYMVQFFMPLILTIVLGLLTMCLVLSLQDGLGNILRRLYP